MHPIPRSFRHLGSPRRFYPIRLIHSAMATDSSQREPRALTSPQLTRISKSMSFVLRHGAAKAGIPMRSDGFVDVDDLLKFPKLRHVTLEDLQQVVAADQKQRYTLVSVDPNTATQPPHWLIRANQGHSLAVKDLQLTPIVSPEEVPTVIHGSYERNWPSIEVQGLKRMTRNHIHFAPDLPNANGVISGMRTSCDLLIYIDAAKAMGDGIRFYRSPNNVILSEGIDGVIPPQYFSQVVHGRSRPIH
ncbi:tRNA 2'-phosphotransferase [Tieghemiomyces parasiticus]|uniref:2'-phosphotransferase n=1 Tax=Tieghemiomyces parasiticus TaxID=78921 RepID=A0A9W8AGB8_9FUNG|nr:tRNA 2'-phosphotransferase [Tieghemiomyces parasiticus]